MLHLLCFLIISGDPTSINLNLNQAIQLALERSPDIQVQNLQVMKAEQNRSLGRALDRPTLSANAQTGLDRTKLSSRPSESSWSTQAGIQSSWELYTAGGNKARNELYINQHGAEQVLLEAERQTVMKQTAIAFYEVLKQMGFVNVAEETLMLTQERLEKAELRHELGQNSQTDLLDAEVAFQDDLAELALRKENLLIAFQSLKTLLYLPSHAQLKVNGNFPELESLRPKDAWIARVLEFNPELRLLQSDQAAGRLDVKVAESAFKPSISLNSQLQFNHDHNWVSSLDSKSDRIFGSVSLNVSYHIFDGRKKRTELANANMTVRQIDHRFSQLQNELEHQVARLHEQLNHRVNRQTLQERTVTKALAYLEIQTERFQLGLIDALTFRDAQIRLAIARQKLVEIQFLALESYLDLLRQTGQMTDILGTSSH